MVGRTFYYMGGVALCVTSLTSYRSVLSLNQVKGSCCLMEQNTLYPQCLVLVGTRNRFERVL